MGICISSVSSENHEAQDGHEDVVHYEESNDSYARPRVVSLYSRTGGKGLNQDAADVYQGFGSTNGAFCGVFDGHGKNGHIVSQTVRNKLRSLILSRVTVVSEKDTNAEGENNHEIDRKATDDQLVLNKSVLKWKDACMSAFKVMDKEIKLLENLDCSTSGTTAVAAIRQEEDLIVANLGDSRAILGKITENGITAVQLSIDLKPGLPSEAERIKRCNGRVIALREEAHIQRVWLPHENMPGLAMSRAFGDFLLKDYGVIALPDLSHHRLTPNDKFLVLATDGIWDVLTNEEVASMVWTAEDSKTAAKLVVDAASAAWQQKFSATKVDDCTVVCYFFHDIKSSLPLPIHATSMDGEGRCKTGNGLLDT